VEIWGPGGSYINPEWKEAMFRDAFSASRKVAARHGRQSGRLIGTGDVPKVLSQLAKQTKADLLVTGATLMAKPADTATQSFARCRFQF